MPLVDVAGRQQRNRVSAEQLDQLDLAAVEGTPGDHVDNGRLASTSRVSRHPPLATQTDRQTGRDGGHLAAVERHDVVDCARRRR